LILDAAERLMRREGYAAVSTRQVAREAGVKPPLVHYHFDTTDNLLLALYRRFTSASEVALKGAIAADDPVRAIWDFNADQEGTVLAAEFLALANHRESIRTEMAADVERLRLLQHDALRRLADVRIGDGQRLSEDAAAMLIAAVARALVAENAVGISAGHDELTRFVNSALATLKVAERSVF
jgi:AcrR family transcriptional regulator